MNFLLKFNQEHIPPNIIPTKRVANNTTNSGISKIANDGLFGEKGSKERLTGDRFATAKTTTMKKTGIKIK